MITNNKFDNEKSFDYDGHGLCRNDGDGTGKTGYPQ